MSDQIKIAIVSFGRGMATFIRPWRFINSVPSKPQEKRGIGMYFARVGYRLRKATDRYAEMHRRFQSMPTETHLAARRPDGAALYYHDTPYPPEAVVELFERHHKGAARELLEMVKSEQATELKVRDRNSRLEYVTRILGMCFAFVLALAIVSGGIVLICYKHEVSGCITLFTGLFGIIGCLATGGKQQPIK